MSKAQFISLRRGPFFVAFWTGGTSGPPYDQVQVGPTTLQKFLEHLRKQLLGTRSRLDSLHKGINHDDLSCGYNRKIMRRMLKASEWAMGTAWTLCPLMEQLYVDWIYPLEEIYTKTAATAYIYGNEPERRKGLQILLHDFAYMGGISKDGGAGAGLGDSVGAYYRAFLEPNNFDPLMYRRFGEFVFELSNLVRGKYPKAAKDLAWHLKWLLDERFTRTDITAPERAQMLVALRTSAADLERTAKDATSAAA